MTKWVEWYEPWYDNLDVIVRSPVEDVIKHQRSREIRYKDDQTALDDFLVIHWATIKEYND